MEVRRARLEDEAAILALASRTLGWDDARFADLYRWKHDQNPFGASPRWVAIEAGRIVGFRVFLRWRFRRGDEVIDAVRAVDTATDPNHQGRGIFRTLTLAALEELRDEGVGFVFNTPNDQSRPGYLKMGWVELGHPPVVVRPRMTGIVRTARARTSASLWSEPSAAGLPVDALDLDRLAKLPRPGTGWHTDADAAHLRWRYVDAPLDYRALRDVDDGWAVFRTRRRGPAREAAVTWVSASSARRRWHLLGAVGRATRADHVLAAGTCRGPAVSALSPLLTGRKVTIEPPGLPDLDLDLGDLELF